MYGLRSRLFVLFNSYLLKPLRTIKLVTVNVMLQEDVLHLNDNSKVLLYISSPVNLSTFKQI